MKNKGKALSVVAMLLALAMLLGVSGYVLPAGAEVPPNVSLNDKWAGEGSVVFEVVYKLTDSDSFYYDPSLNGICDDSTKIDSANYTVAETENGTLITFSELYLKSLNLVGKTSVYFICMAAVISPLYLDLDVEIPNKPGDVNGDGMINALDAALILQYDAKLIDETQLDKTAADVNGDGQVNALDSSLILQYDAKLIPGFSPDDDFPFEIGDGSDIKLSGGGLEVSVSDGEWLAIRILQLLNEERMAAGEEPVLTAPTAHLIALDRARELETLFAHYRPDGSPFWTIYGEYKYNPTTPYDGYCPSRCGEDVAKTSLWFYSNEEENKIEAYTREGLARRVIEQFKNSPEHWADLMNPAYSGVGIGVHIIKKDDLTQDIAYTAIEMMSRTYG